MRCAITTGGILWGDSIKPAPSVWTGHQSRRTGSNETGTASMGNRNIIVAHAAELADALTEGSDIDAFPAAVLGCVATGDFEPVADCVRRKR